MPKFLSVHDSGCVVCVEQAVGKGYDLDYQETRRLFTSPQPTPEHFFSYNTSGDAFDVRFEAFASFETESRAKAFVTHFTSDDEYTSGAYKVHYKPSPAHFRKALTHITHILPKSASRICCTFDSAANGIRSISQRFKSFHNKQALTALTTDIASTTQETEVVRDRIVELVTEREKLHSQLENIHTLNTAHQVPPHYAAPAADDELDPDVTLVSEGVDANNSGVFDLTFVGLEDYEGKVRDPDEWYNEWSVHPEPYDEENPSEVIADSWDAFFLY